MSTVLNRLRKQPQAEEQQRAVPDSTTIVDRLVVADFAGGQDVLLKKDGKYYCGTVVEVDGIREQCYVKFGDNTDHWACFKDLVKLSTPKDPMCVVCRKSTPKSKDVIRECDKCKRAYHRKCHQPAISDDAADDSWICGRCIETVAERAKRKTSQGYVVNMKVARKLPYDPDTLTWDSCHRTNVEDIYCYCGRPGLWDTQMLQCSRCRQWFHETCITILRFPIYSGDRFYVFACANCNDGVEFIRRLEINWVDLVHIALFNLTMYKSRKYFDLDKIIMPFFDDNWHALQLPPKIFRVTNLHERREFVLNVLTKNRKRFKCGREVKKRTTFWGLRVPLPPPVPMIQLPPAGQISANELKVRWAGNRQLKFLPCTESTPFVHVAKEVMTGACHQDDLGHSESESPCPSPKSEEAEDSPPPAQNTFIHSGAVKKSVPFPSLKHKKRLLSLNSRKRDKILRRQKRDQPRRLTRLSLDSRNSNSKQDRSKEPLTPPTSVSAPPTPPNSGSSSNVHSELSMDFNDGFVLDKVKVKDEPHTPCDTSGDETSSKSTLDLIIPPPKDFEGKNNPFRAFPRVDDARKRRSKDTITLPLPLTAVIPGKPIARPLKRQLSEKDICIGPNGEVKRRRLRRSRSGGNYMPPTATASKTATIVPARADSDWQTHQALETNLISDCVDYALNGRRLRQRQEKNDKEKKPPTPKPSPAKTEPDICMDDLKSSVHSYFGAATRIQDGERFVVRAKRYGPTGKLEYLMEWEGVKNT